MSERLEPNQEGKTTNEYFPSVAERLKMRKITTNYKLTTMITGHGIINFYLQSFKISNSLTCLWGEADQTTDHLLYECKLLDKERDNLRSTSTSTSESRPISKHLFATKHYEAFKRFANQIPFENLH